MREAGIGLLSELNEISSVAGESIGLPKSNEKFVLSVACEIGDGIGESIGDGIGDGISTGDIVGVKGEEVVGIPDRFENVNGKPKTGEDDVVARKLKLLVEQDAVGSLVVAF